MSEDRARNIRQWRYYVDDDRSLPTGWRRFWSADVHFPITIGCPPGSSPYYNRDRMHKDPHLLLLETNAGFTVTRQYPIHADPVSFVKTWVETWLNTRRQLSDPRWSSELDRAGYKDAYKYRIIDRGSELAIVGAHGYAFKAPCVIFTKRSGLFGTGSGEVTEEWVFFSRRGIDEVWAIIRDAREIDEDDFKVVLASFRWLNDEYFRSLPA